MKLSKCICQRFSPLHFMKLIIQGELNELLTFCHGMRAVLSDCLSQKEEWRRWKSIEMTFTLIRLLRLNLKPLNCLRNWVPPGCCCRCRPGPRWGTALPPCCRRTASRGAGCPGRRCTWPGTPPPCCGSQGSRRNLRSHPRTLEYRDEQGCKLPCTDRI